MSLLSPRATKELMLKKQLSDAWLLPAVVLLAFLLVRPADAQSVVIHLKNGDRLSGLILSEGTNSVRLTNQFLGLIEVPLAEINRRETLPAPAVTVPPAPTTNAPAIATVPATNVVASPNIVAASTNVPAATPPPKPPLSPANPEATPIASTPSYWKHDLRFGLNLRYATKDSHEFLSILKSTYGKPPFRHIFDVNFKYGRVEGALAANSLAASEKTEYQLTPRSYVFNLIGGGYDEIRKIDYQFEVGPGFGMELLKLTNFGVES